MNDPPRQWAAADFEFEPAAESTRAAESKAPDEPGMLLFRGKLDTHKHSGKPYDTITWSTIVAMAAKPAKVEKNKLRPDDPEPNLPSFIPSTYHKFDGREFARQRAVGDFALATADIDTGNPSLDDVMKASTAIFGVGAELLIYSSSSAKEDERKWRLLVPLAEGVPGEEREVTQRALFDLMAEQGIQCDSALARAGQTHYRPNVPPSRRQQHCDDPIFYQWHHCKGEPARLDTKHPVMVRAVEIMRRERQAQEAAAREAEEQRRRRREKIANGTAKVGDRIIDWFNENHPIEDVMLACGYKTDRRGHWQSPLQTSESYATIVVDGRTLISFSGSDRDAGLGTLSRNPSKRVCIYGDAYDLFVRFEHSGDHAKAWRALRQMMPKEAPPEFGIFNGGRSHQHQHQQQDQPKPEQPKDDAKAGQAGPEAGQGANGSAGAEDRARGAPIHPMLRIKTHNDNVTLTRMIVPGFIAAGIAIIAGYQGVGKTTAVLPLAAVVAGIKIRLKDPLQPRHWRNVVYISEDMDQVKRILVAIANGDSQATQRIKDRFKLVDACGLSAEKFVQVGDTYVERFSRVVDGVSIPPLVVIDTKSAAFEIEDENDNAEASALMRALKFGFAGLPTWVIGHVAKTNMTRSNAAEMSLRGASSFEGDANQVLFLVAENEQRYLVRGKTRFEARWKEVAVQTETFERDAVDEFGEPGRLILRRATFEPLGAGEREKKAEERKADLRVSERQNRVYAILKVVREAREAGQMINRDAVARKVGGNKAAVTNSIGRLVDVGALAELGLPSHLRTHFNRKAFLIDLEGDEQAAYRTTGEVPEEKVEQVDPRFAQWRSEQKAARPAKGSGAAGAGTGEGVKIGEGDAMRC